jgi:3-deoxy-D-manno-octulosonate 8-phosphate phosphatase (KDO 8-P phosphatase)
MGTRIPNGAKDLTERLSRIKAVVFDWDGVFNDGFKDLDGGSPFSEVGSMGVNLLRFALWLKNAEQLPYAAVITGQHNAHAEKFTQREKLHGLYMGFTNKPEAFDAFLTEHGLREEEVAFVFDDVLDLPVAARCGVRVMLAGKATSCLAEKVIARKEVDALVSLGGGENGLRVATDVLIELSGMGDEVIDHRVRYSDVYQRYLGQRQAVLPRVVRKER